MHTLAFLSFIPLLHVFIRRGTSEYLPPLKLCELFMQTDEGMSWFYWCQWQLNKCNFDFLKLFERSALLIEKDLDTILIKKIQIPFQDLHIIFVEKIQIPSSISQNQRQTEAQWLKDNEMVANPSKFQLTFLSKYKRIEKKKHVF